MGWKAADPDLQVVRELRRPDGEATKSSDLSVLRLSGAAGDLCQLGAAFEAGVDDFQPISVSYLVLRARLTALISRSQLARSGEGLRVGGLRLDRGSREAGFAGRRLELTNLDFGPLYQLARQPGSTAARSCCASAASRCSRSASTVSD
jgi:DNA-binding response OmpR family regulator